MQHSLRRRCLPFLMTVVTAAACADTATSPSSDRSALTLQVSSARAEVVRRADGPASIEYTVCYAIGVGTVVRRPMTIRGIEFTVLGADGSIYSSTAESSVNGERIGGGASNGFYGCRVVFTEPAGATPTATAYRMRVEYTFDIGGVPAPHAVSAEGTFAIASLGTP